MDNILRLSYDSGIETIDEEDRMGLHNEHILEGEVVIRVEYRYDKHSSELRFVHPDLRGELFVDDEGLNYLETLIQRIDLSHRLAKPSLYNSGGSGTSSTTSSSYPSSSSSSGYTSSSYSSSSRSYFSPSPPPPPSSSYTTRSYGEPTVADTVTDVKDFGNSLIRFCNFFFAKKKDK